MSSHFKESGDNSRRMVAMSAELGVKVMEWYSMIRPDTASYNMHDDHDNNNPFAIGSKRSFVPPLGDILWETPLELEERAYYAYLCQLSDGRNIGYIRVPNYKYNPDAIDAFEEIIARFEHETDALIIDQVNNSGGSMFQMYSILEMLTDRALALPKHQITIDDDLAAVANDVITEAAIGDTMQSDNLPSPDLLAYYRFVLSEKEAGRGTAEKLTNPVHLSGIAEIQPAKIHYTKEIIVLINELDFSASEFLAAILQDNNRAMLFGQRTAGAGGCVKRRNIPNSHLFGIAYYTLTWTIAWRKNGQPIENVGVNPDFPYVITSEDLQSGFAGYRRALLSCLSKA